MAISGKGAASGALGGAAVGGAIGGPIGAGVGALAGGVLGAFGQGAEDEDRKRQLAAAIAASRPQYDPLGRTSIHGNAFRDPFGGAMGQLSQRAAGAQGRNAPGMRGVDLATQMQGRERQMSLADALLATAQGRGQSVAQNQLNLGMQQALAQVQAAQAAQRGINPGMALRQTQTAMANIGADISGQAALLRAQETLAAQQALGNVLAQSRGQDLSAAGLQQRGEEFRSDAALRQRALNDQLTMFYERLVGDKQQAQFLANQELARMQTEAQLRESQLATILEQQRMRNVAGLHGGAMGPPSSFSTDLGFALAKAGGEELVRKGIGGGGGK